MSRVAARQGRCRVWQQRDATCTPGARPPEMCVPRLSLHNAPAARAGALQENKPRSLPAAIAPSCHVFCECFAICASISAPNLGMFSHASYFIRIPVTNKIGEYGRNLQRIKFERWRAGQVKYFSNTYQAMPRYPRHRLVRLCVPEATDVSQIMRAQVDFSKIVLFLESRAQINLVSPIVFCDLGSSGRESIAAAWFVL